MPKFGKLSLIGAGNLGFHLAQSLKDNGFEIVDILSRSEKDVESLADLVGAKPIYSIEDLSDDVDAIILATPESFIINIEIPKSLMSKTWIHTSGSTELKFLSDKVDNAGVLWPIQSFTKEHQKMDFTDVPICITASNISTKKSIKELAADLSNTVIYLDDHKRIIAHMTAVIVNNFSNHLFTLADDLLSESEMSFEILKPIIKSTIDKLDDLKPIDAQTGPARRGNKAIQKKHLNLLSDHKDLRKIYKSISKSITKKYKE